MNHDSQSTTMCSLTTTNIPRNKNNLEDCGCLIDRMDGRHLRRFAY